MTNTIYIHQPEKAFSFTRLPNFLFEAPTFKPLSNEAKVLYAFILRRTELSRKNGWADDCGRIYLYYPICEVVDLLHCGRQKAVNTLRELQYAGLVEIQKQGCGKPNRIFPKSYAIGYTDDFTKAEDRTYRKVDAMMQQDWYFSMKAFTEFKEKLQNRIHWDYSGETEILILQNNPGKRNILNFQNYVAIDVNKGIREGYIDSFQSFMESLIRSSKRRVTAKEAIRDVRNARISIKDIIAGAIDDCKKVPTPIKEIAKDRLFYRCANTML